MGLTTSVTSQKNARNSITLAPVTPELRARNQLLSHIDDWNFDMFEVGKFSVFNSSWV
jgi:hypothetical protein